MARRAESLSTSSGKMEHRGAGDLDGPALGERSPTRHDAGGDLPRDVEELRLLGLGEPPLLARELGDQVVLAASRKAHPGENEVDLQVDQLVRGESFLGA